MMNWFRWSKRRLLLHGADFAETTEELRSPARGWYQIYPLQVEREPDLEELRWCLREEETCALVFLDIGAYQNRDLDEEALTHIRRYLDFFDKNKKDVILRAAYDRAGKGAEREPSLFSQVAAHIRQLEPILREFDRRIVLFEGMLVGNWGEMHGSRFLTKKNMTRLNELIAHSAPRITRAVRRPAQWRILHQTPPGPETGVGLYNDAIFGSETDLGTFAPADSPDGGWEAPWPVGRELSFEEKLRDFVPQCGEAVCGERYQGYTLADTVERLRKMGMTWLNGVYDDKILSIWKGWTWNSPDIWQGMNGYDYIGRHLGYRFCVRSAGARMNAGFCELSLEIENVGFSGFYQEARVWLILADEHGQETEILTDWDVRTWKSGQTARLTWRIPCREGTLWLSAKREWDGETIRFANKGTERGRVLIGELRT